MIWNRTGGVLELKGVHQGMLNLFTMFVILIQEVGSIINLYFIFIKCVISIYNVQYGCGNKYRMTVK